MVSNQLLVSVNTQDEQNEDETKFQKDREANSLIKFSNSKESILGSTTLDPVKIKVLIPQSPESRKAKNKTIDLVDDDV